MSTAAVASKRLVPATLVPTTLVLGAVLAVTAGCPVLGVRLLHVDYRVDGELVLRTYYEDPDARRADDVWDYLNRRPVMVQEETCTVEPSPEAPLRARLHGAVTIEVLHVDRSLRRAEIREVGLVRDDAQDLRWHLSTAERDRTRPR